MSSGFVVAASAPSTGSVAVIAALVAATVSVLVAIGTQAELARRERNSRRYDRRRAALLDVQGAVVELRDRLERFGRLSRQLKGLQTPEFVEAQSAMDRAQMWLRVTLSRVDPPVAEIVEGWERAAQLRYLDTAEVSEATARAKWDALHAVIGTALQHPEVRTSGAAHTA